MYKDRIFLREEIGLNFEGRAVSESDLIPSQYGFNDLVNV